jgi:hypothetical protein
MVEFLVISLEAVDLADQIHQIAFFWLGDLFSGLSIGLSDERVLKTIGAGVRVIVLSVIAVIIDGNDLLSGKFSVFVDAHCG